MLQYDHFKTICKLYVQKYIFCDTTIYIIFLAKNLTYSKVIPQTDMKKWLPTTKNDFEIIFYFNLT